MTMASKVTDLPGSARREQKGSFYPEPSPNFVATPEIETICNRALAYLEAGYPVHLSGPSGIGKTTLAFHIASQLDQPAVLLHGNHEHGASDLIGSDVGYRKSRVVDNYIHSVLKTQEEMRKMWVDSRLATACRQGHTLIYDEFNRTQPEANNVLLSVLEEKLLSLPGPSGQSYVQVDDTFRAIFTSNPAEYVGTHATQDALMDRLVTIHLTSLEEETEHQIILRRAGANAETALKLTRLVRAVRQFDPETHWPSIRVGVAIAKVMDNHPDEPTVASDFFRDVCRDMFLAHPASTEPDDPDLEAHLMEVMGIFCPSPISEASDE